MPHSCGHHLGLDCHDHCDASPLRSGAALALELGVYLPGRPHPRVRRSTVEAAGPGGVRVEDNVILTDTGARNLTHRHVAELRT